MGMTNTYEIHLYFVLADVLFDLWILRKSFSDCLRKWAIANISGRDHQVLASSSLKLLAVVH
jgi:hypothetical protein